MSDKHLTFYVSLWCNDRVEKEVNVHLPKRKASRNYVIKQTFYCSEIFLIIGLSASAQSNIAISRVESHCAAICSFNTYLCPTGWQRKACIVISKSG